MNGAIECLAPNATLSEAEITRNTHGTAYLICYDVSEVESLVSSFSEGELPDIPVAHSSITPYTNPELPPGIPFFVPELSQGYTMQVQSLALPLLFSYDLLYTTPLATCLLVSPGAFTLIALLFSYDLLYTTPPATCLLVSPGVFTLIAPSLLLWPLMHHPTGDLPSRITRCINSHCPFSSLTTSYLLY